MSKLKAIGRGALAAGSVIGGFSTITGHGIIAVCAGILKVRVPLWSISSSSKVSI